MMSSAADSTISLPDEPSDVGVGQEHKQRLVGESLPDDAISGHARDHGARLERYNAEARVVSS
jgi:hypothetical protein